jgi:hypothetical protein
MKTNVETLKKEIASGVQSYFNKEQVLAILDKVEIQTNTQTQIKLF